MRHLTTIALLLNLCAITYCETNVWPTYGGSNQRSFFLDAATKPQSNWTYQQPVPDQFLFGNLIVASGEGVLLIYARWPTVDNAGIFAISMETGKELGNSIPGTYVALTISKTSKYEILYALGRDCELSSFSVSSSKGLSLLSNKTIDYPVCARMIIDAEKGIALVSARDEYSDIGGILAIVNLSNGKVIDEVTFPNQNFVGTELTALTTRAIFSVSYNSSLDLTKGVGWTSFSSKSGKFSWFNTVSAKSDSYITIPAFSPDENLMFFQTSMCDDDDGGACTPALNCLNTENGHLEWKVNLELGGVGGNNELGIPIVVGNLKSYEYDYMIVVYSYYNVYAFDHHGNRLWSYSGSFGTLSVSNDNKILLSDGALLSETGKKVGFIPLPSSGVIGTIVDKKGNYFYWDLNVIAALDLESSSGASPTDNENSSGSTALQYHVVGTVLLCLFPLLQGL